MTCYKFNQKEKRKKKLESLLCTHDKQTEEEVRETTLFTMATDNIKYLWLTLTKQVKDLYNKNLESVKTEIEEDVRRWKYLHVNGSMGLT